MKPELTPHSTTCFSFGQSSTATQYKNETRASGNISVGPSCCISDKGHEPRSRSCYWVSEVRPPLDPGTDLSGTWGMRSWLAGVEMCQRGHMTPEYEVPPLWHWAQNLRGNVQPKHTLRARTNTRLSLYSPAESSIYLWWGWEDTVWDLIWEWLFFVQPFLSQQINSGSSLITQDKSKTKCG